MTLLRRPWNLFLNCHRFLTKTFCIPFGTPSDQHLSPQPTFEPGHVYGLVPLRDEELSLHLSPLIHGHGSGYAFPLHVENSVGCPSILNAYLEQQENGAAEILRLGHILGMSHIVLEIGCGRGEVAWQIAINNPDMGVIATDLYDWSGAQEGCSHYQKTADAWRGNRLAAQRATLSNLVVLRADAEILRFLPIQRLDSILLVNPEPKVGKTFLSFLHANGLDRHIKPGPRQLVIVPYSSEIGMSACGGLEFDHSEDWSKGLGFLFESAFDFSKGAQIHWGTDLATLSPYTKNSSQTDVYCAGRLAPPQR